MTNKRLFLALALRCLAGRLRRSRRQRRCKPVTMASALSAADAAVKAGRADQAYVILKVPRPTNPTDKAPWLRMAQLRFDDKNYGETIVSGLAVIERDPDDTLAYSLVAASGLRVSSKALADLTRKNGFQGTARSEAQELANLLHSTLKETVVPRQTCRGCLRKAPGTANDLPGTAVRAADCTCERSNGVCSSTSDVAAALRRDVDRRLRGNDAGCD